MHHVGGDHRPLTGEEEPGAGDGASLGEDLLVGEEEGLYVQRLKRLVKRPLSLGPDEDGHEGKRGEDDGPVAAVGQLVQVGNEKDGVDKGDRKGDGRLPLLGGIGEDPGHHDAGDGHGPGDGKAVCGRQVLRLPEQEHDEDDQHQEGPVHRADVDLGLQVAGGVVHLHEWHDSRRDPLVDDGEDAADQCLGGDHRGDDGEEEKRDVHDRGLSVDHREQRVLLVLVLQQESTLAQIIDDEGGEDEVPGAHDRLSPQVPHVGVERFTAGGAQDDLGEDEEAGYAVVQEELDGVPG